MQNPQKSLGMGKSNKEDLSQSLIMHPNAIKLLDQTASLTVEQIKWQQVIQMSDHLSKQATIVGMLWNEESPKAESLKETIESYFISLQRFLLCCHKIAVAAGPTLSSLIHVSVKQIVDSSFELSKGSVSLYEGTYEKDKKPYIPKLTAVVLEALFNFKKVPSTNLIAIGNAISQVAVIMKDVLNKMKDVKRPSRECEASSCDVFSPEQIEFAKLVADVVSEAIMVVIVIRVMTKTIGMENPKEDSEFVDSLEKVLKLCQRSGVEIEKLGTCVCHHPPLEIDKMVETVKILGGNLDEVEAEVEHKKWSSNAFPGVCRNMRDAIKVMEVGLEKRKDLNQIMIAHQNTIYNTLQLFDPTASPPTQEKS
ncbi:PREDICTED: uncharacterized protein LOC104756655 [Camelina sativa]|uniref:Uncharacterized protein LOC104756655 n=1 Tax=Camelina sativa TaxID=90675 RepID=A0ABM0WXI6_CAMSA|nr:PREDICTED: uncharacterized protein LOC104756655 [Camelina sativa]